MRRTAFRLVLAGFVSTLAIGVIPAQADASQVHSAYLSCCR